MSTSSFEAKDITLGFIGLGNMGSRIVRRLLDAGYKTFVYSVAPLEAHTLHKEGVSHDWSSRGLKASRLR